MRNWWLTRSKRTRWIVMVLIALFFLGAYTNTITADEKAKAKAAEDRATAAEAKVETAESAQADAEAAQAEAEAALEEETAARKDAEEALEEALAPPEEPAPVPPAAPTGGAGDGINVPNAPNVNVPSLKRAIPGSHCVGKGIFRACV